MERCKRRDGNKNAWKPGAHRIVVRKGYGVPLMFEPK